MTTEEAVGSFDASHGPRARQEAHLKRCIEDAAATHTHARGRGARAMPPKRASERTRDDLRKAEREIGSNIPDEMVGEDDGDVGDVERHAHAEKA